MRQKDWRPDVSIAAPMGLTDKNLFDYCDNHRYKRNRK